MKRSKLSLALILVVMGFATLFFTLNGRPEAPQVGRAAAAPSSVSPRAGLIPAPGRVEPVSEEIEVGADVEGRLSAVLVEEGEKVVKGQVIARIENSRQAAQVASAEANLQRREAELRRLVNGARGQERREALAATQEAEAILANARVEMDRRRALFEKGVLSREEADRATREWEVAQSRFKAVSERHALIEDDAREEDVQKAEAGVALARAELAEARAVLAKTVIRAPITGTVLRRFLQTGETYSMSSRSLTPVIVTLGDLSSLRVRADVDETDVADLRVGQRAYVVADAYGDRKFWGKVVRVGQSLGRKNVRTDEPTERVDTKILETLIELDPGADLPVGLRVDAFILLDS